jgi:hypothetical protein
MMQMFHIFRKDVRHLWVELGVYAGLLAVFVVAEPYTWAGAAVSGIQLVMLAGLLKLLIPVMWLSLVARLVQDEALVGDRQFWMTRPYAWGSLLAAKVLFVAVCVVLPFAVMQWALVARAGLELWPAVPAQGPELLLLALLVWLPFVAVAAVTRSVQRTFLTLLGTVVVLGLLVPTLASMTLMAPPRMVPPYTLGAFAVVFGGGLVSVLVYQYATRRTGQSNGALVALVVLMMLVYVGFARGYGGGLVDALTRLRFPVAGGVRLVLDGGPERYREHEGDVTKTTLQSLVPVTLPLRLEGLPEWENLDGTYASVTVEAEGFRYVSPWVRATLAQTSVSVPMLGSILREVEGKKVRVHLSLVAERVVAEAPQRVTVAERFAAPGWGRCELTESVVPNQNMVKCRYPFAVPTHMRVDNLVGGACNGGPQGRLVSSTTLNGMMPGVGLDPVVQEPLLLGAQVCEGTQLEFVKDRAVGRVRVEADVPGGWLGSYRVR